MALIQQALVFLVATVVAVPLFKRLGLGTVLGYLAAGVAIGPWGLRLITDVENILHFAEFGVVLFLFVVGLELEPSRLWALRRAVFGLGGAQVALTTVVLTGIGVALGLPVTVAAVAALGLSLSSTALALQLLAEKNQLTTEHGRASFGILLFQDLAVIPVMALLPVLAAKAPVAGADPMWLSTLKAVGVLAAILVGGRFILRPVFKIIARTRSQEVFTAAALLVVVGTASIVSLVGLSMALGAFVAGVLLADTEYRHELETDIEPFKGLLLGLFFIAVGMSVNLGLVAERPLLVMALVLGLVAAKAAILYAIGRFWCKGNAEPALSLSIVLSQGGEFAFVLYGIAVKLGILPGHISDLLIVVVSVSMATTPVLSALFERFVRPRFHEKVAREFDVPPVEDNPVIIAGFGRVGQVVGRVLTAKRIGFTALDNSPDHIDFLRKFGNKIYYGDASRIDLLRAAGAEKARVFVLAIDDVDMSVRTAHTVMEHFPHLQIYARARNRQHAYQLRDMGITELTRETFASSLELTRGVLEAVGLPIDQAITTIERFRQHDEELLERSYMHRQDMPKLVAMATSARSELQKLFEEDAAERRRAG